jgi:selenocysteine lyase/cysteine desulfurase
MVDLAERVTQWRSDTPGCRDVIHLNNAGASLMPRVVLEAIIGHVAKEAHHGGYEAAELERDRVSRVYADLAELIGAHPRNIAIVENATVAISQTLSAFVWKAGDRILTTRADYASNQLMLLRLRDLTGVIIDYAPDASVGGVDVEGVDRMLRERRYALVVATWIPTNSGLVQDVASIGASCERRGVPYLIDACQAVGQLPVDVGSLRCDFLAATARKFMRGPRGIGFLYISDRALQRGAAPLFTDIRGTSWIGPDQFVLTPDARRFENWEFAYSLILGMGAAVRYALEIGIATIGDRALGLAESLRVRLASDSRFSILDRGAKRSAIVSIGFASGDPLAAVAPLRRRGINVWAIPREHAVFDMDDKGATAVLRVSPHYYNTEDELEAFVAALDEWKEAGS